MDQRTKGIAIGLFGSGPIVTTIDFGREFKIEHFALQTVVASEAYLETAKALKVSGTIVSSSLIVYAGLIAPILREGTHKDFAAKASMAFGYFDILESVFPKDEVAAEVATPVETKKEPEATGTPEADAVKPDADKPEGSEADKPESGADKPAGDFPTEKLELPDSVKEKLIQAGMTTAQIVRVKDKTGEVLAISGIGQVVRDRIIAAVDKAIGPEVAN